MIYLSRLMLNPRSREVRRDLSDCHGLHRTILRAFPQADNAAGARDRFGVLHRVDTARSITIALLVQSSVHPDWSQLPHGYLAEEPPTVKEIEALYQRISTGARLIFRLRANPTKRVSARAHGEDPKWRGKRVDLQREEDQLAWLTRKGTAHGFELLQVSSRRDVPAVQTLSGQQTTGKRNGERLTFGSVLFEGMLRVTDADALRQALSEGIGSGKAYGFGLLSIAPA